MKTKQTSAGQRPARMTCDNALATLAGHLAPIFRPPSQLTVSQWAERERYLSRGIYSTKYSNATCPWQREPMDCANDPEVQSVVLMWASQLTGKTTVGENVVGYHISESPSNILYVLDAKDRAEQWSKTRLDRMLDSSPCFRSLIQPRRSRDSGNTIFHKRFPGGDIAIVGANAPGGLAMLDRGVLILDEIDRYPPSAGGEGDPVLIAEKRTASFPDAVIYKISSPTIKGTSRVEKDYADSDKRLWYCPCPLCGAYQTLHWSQVKWGKTRREAAGLPPDPDAPTDGSDAVYECEACKAHLNDTQRRGMSLLGQWRPTAPFHGRRGYHLSGLATTFRCHRGFKSRLHEMVSDFLTASKGGPITLQTWVNTFLAETYEEKGEIQDHQTLLSRGESYTPDALPNEIVLLVVGTDVQKDRLELEVIGIGVDDETWGVEALRIFGDTEQDDVWQDWSNALARKYRRADGAELEITAVGVDMRYNRHQVRKWVRQCGHPRVYPMFGIGGQQQAFVVSKTDKRYRLRTHTVNTFEAKRRIYARLQITDPGPRYLHFPKGHGYSEEYFKQLCSNFLKTTYSKGFPVLVYEKAPSSRDEALDRRVYALAALHVLNPNLTAIARQLKAESAPHREYQLKPAHTEKPAAQAQRPAPPPRRGGIFNPLGL